MNLRPFNSYSWLPKNSGLSTSFCRCQIPFTSRQLDGQGPDPPWGPADPSEWQTPPRASTSNRSPTDSMSFVHERCGPRPVVFFCWKKYCLWASIIVDNPNKQEDAKQKVLNISFILTCSIYSSRVSLRHHAPSQT